MTRDDLVAYAKHRRALVKNSSWDTEEATIAGFFAYAAAAGWIDRDPRPLWGPNKCDTRRSGIRTRRKVKFLAEPQLRAFLDLDLRGNAATPNPSYPDRDYCYGLTLVSTGLSPHDSNARDTHSYSGVPGERAATMRCNSMRGVRAFRYAGAARVGVAGDPTAEMT